MLSVYRSIQALGNGIINTWDQNTVAGGDRIALTYTPHDRCTPASGWHVARWKDGVALVTDSKAAWYDGKLKAFPCFSGKADKERARLEAVEWIAAKYGPRDLVRNAMGDFVEREVQELYPIRRRRA